MANMVQRATSHLLGGPDWAMNMELCNLINNDPGIAKNSVKAVKRRMGNKNPKTQVLAITVLETMVRNCGEVVHDQVVLRGILHDMVKLAKKSKDEQVREKILMLIDSWQEAFGGPNGRYPQYFMAYDELRRSGIIFPKRMDTGNLKFTPAQSRMNDHNYVSPERPSVNTNEEAEASRSSDLPGLSLSDIHNTRSGMEVLAEMLDAIDPKKNRQALKDEVIVELVEQCRTAEKRVMQLVNTTVNEDLLQQGLALNDDLKRVLARVDAIESGVPLQSEPAAAPSLLIEGLGQDNPNDVLSQLTHSSTQEVKPTSVVALLDLPAANEQPNQLALTGSATSPNIDLLSGETFQGKDVSPLVASPMPEKALETVSFLSHEGTTNVASSSGGQGVIPPAFYNLHQQNDPIYMQQNGGSQSQFSGLPGQTTNSYVVPWALPPPSGGVPVGSFQPVNVGTEQSIANSSSSAFIPQQSAFMYGGSAASGSSLSPQPAATIYGVSQQETSNFGSAQSYLYGASPASYVSSPPNFPYANGVSNISSQPPLFQVYNSPLQMQPQYQQPPQFLQGHNLTPGPYAYNQGLMGSQTANNSSSLPSAPWSTGNMTTLQNSDPYGNSFASSPQGQQQQLQFQYDGISGQMQGLSLQRPGSVSSAPPQQSAYGTPEAGYTLAPRKEVQNAGLFKDLVDLSKVK